MLPKCGTKARQKYTELSERTQFRRQKSLYRAITKKIINRDDPVYSNVMIYGTNIAGNKLNAKIIAGC